MIDPRQHLADVMHRPCLRHGGPADHDDGQAKHARCIDLGARALPTGIFRDDQIHAMIAHQGKVALQREGTAIHQQMVTRERGRHVWCIDEAQQIMMLGLCGEGFDMHATERQHYTPPRAIKRADSASDVRHMGPAVPLHRSPFRPGEHQVRDARIARRCGGIGADRRGKGMGRIDKMRERSYLEESRQPTRAAKTTDPHRHRLGTRIVGAPGIAQDRALAAFGERLGKRARLGRAAKDQDVAHGG